MTMTLDDLRAFGANVDEGLARCMNMEAFYLRLVNSVKQEANFAALFAAMEAHDLEAGFKAAHALKGVLGNLSLTPLYEPMIELTELLRVRADVDYTNLVALIRQRYDAFCAL